MQTSTFEAIRSAVRHAYGAVATGDYVASGVIEAVKPVADARRGPDGRVEACCDSVLLDTCCPPAAKTACCGQDHAVALCGCQAELA